MSHTFSDCVENASRDAIRHRLEAHTAQIELRTLDPASRDGAEHQVGRLNRKRPRENADRQWLRHASRLGWVRGHARIEW
jgi:hypothetical protein